MLHRLALAALLLVLPAAAAMAGPDLVPGDTFVYDSRGRTVTQTYAGATADGNHRFRLGNGGEAILSPSLSLVERPGTRVEPHNGQLVLDPAEGFAVGKEWALPYTVIRKNGSRSEKRRICSVAAHDPARTMRAGTFDAWRVVCTIETEGGGTRFSDGWYDARTWRSLELRVGDNPDDLRTTLELVEVSLAPR